MKKFVLDSCVFIKLFLPEEEDSKKALRLMDTIIDEQIEVLVPRLFYYEIFGISKKMGIPSADVWSILQDYEISLLSYVNEDRKTTKKTIEICETGNTKSGFPHFYDSSYHALAILNNCDFITADRRHYEKTKGLGNIKLLAEMELV